MLPDGRFHGLIKFEILRLCGLVCLAKFGHVWLIKTQLWQNWVGQGWQKDDKGTGRHSTLKMKVNREKFAFANGGSERCSAAGHKV